MTNKEAWEPAEAGGWQRKKKTVGDTVTGKESFRAEPDGQTPEITNPQKVDVSSFHNEEIFQQDLPFIKKAENYAKEKFGVDIKGVIPAIYSQESSFGVADTNKNPQIGEEAYRMGLTEAAKKELEKAGVKTDFNTKQGVMNAAAAFFAIKGNVYDYDKKTDTQTLNERATQEYKDDPAKTYAERYYGGDEDVYDIIKKKIDYYKGLDY